jgi:ATP-dependent DNA helicase DinG
MPSIVALDIETTGLDPKTDAIIEIGAVRFNGKRIEEQWETLVNPGRPIPAFINQLTGINDAMVRNAPPLKVVLPELVNFVGDLPVLGHNVRFDLSFFAAHGALRFNETIDTYEMAGVLLPTATRYGLEALGQQLGVLHPGAHRALNDALVTHAVFNRLYEKSLELPVEMLAEFVRLSEPFEWGASYIFKEILRVKAREPVQARRTRDGIHGPLFGEPPEKGFTPLQPVDELTPLDVDEVAALLEHGGPFSHNNPQYEYRPQQVEMLRQVAKALSESRHLMVEAGTGVGKSFAYLVPAALWAMQNNTRVVISTNTINLQDQLIRKDIPDLRTILDIDLHAAVLKGRSNYLCPRRLEIMRQRGPSNAEEMRVLAKVLVWLYENGSGDRGEINLNGAAEKDVWTHLSAEDDGCSTENCLKHTGGACPFYQARQAAQSAHILVVNHALLLSDVITASRVLPEYNYLIVDEAHHLESATTSALSYRITQFDLERMLRELGGSTSGILGHALSSTRDALRPSDFAAFNQLIQRATDISFRLENLFQNFFEVLIEFMADRRDGRPVGTYTQQERILPSTRTLPQWSEVEMAWEETQETLLLLLNLIKQIYENLGEMTSNGMEELEDTQNNLGSVYRRLTEAHVNMVALVGKPEPDKIYWIELPPSGRMPALQVAPLHVGPLMEKYLWHEKASVILTSATLTTAGEFDYLRNRLFADEADELALGSPFDYESAALLYVVKDIPEPTDVHHYQRAVETALKSLCKATGGRTLALFTSYAQLKKTSQAIAPALAADGIQIYEQGEGASPIALMETFRGAEKAVLLGTRSFWEGVDIPGEALSVLVIVKLPFDVPSDPIVAARSETFDDPFNEYSVPEAILRFRQGFGRLIRSQTDRGAVVVLDKRILGKSYGRAFIESLPPCSKKEGLLADLPRTVSRWLNL